MTRRLLHISAALAIALTIGITAVLATIAHANPHGARPTVPTPSLSLGITHPIPPMPQSGGTTPAT